MNIENRKRRVWAVRLVCAAALAGVCAVAWLSTHHLVRTPRGTAIVAKRYVTLRESVVDIRGWAWQDAERHADVTAALRQAGYGDLLPRRPGLVQRATRAVRELGVRTGLACRSAWQRVRGATGKCLADARDYWFPAQPHAG